MNHKISDERNNKNETCHRNNLQEAIRKIEDRKQGDKKGKSGTTEQKQV